MNYFYANGKIKDLNGEELNLLDHVYSVRSSSKYLTLKSLARIKDIFFRLEYPHISPHKSYTSILHTNFINKKYSYSENSFFVNSSCGVYMESLKPGIKKRWDGAIRDYVYPPGHNYIMEYELIGSCHVDIKYNSFKESKKIYYYPTYAIIDDFCSTKVGLVKAYRSDEVFKRISPTNFNWDNMKVTSSYKPRIKDISYNSDEQLLCKEVVILTPKQPTSDTFTYMDITNYEH